MNDPVDRAFTAFLVVTTAAVLILGGLVVIDMAAWLTLDLIRYWHELRNVIAH